MPNRILRDWTDSDRFDGISAEAERMFTRLLMKVDDFGRFHAEWRRLKAALFPLSANLRQDDLTRPLNELAARQLILLYMSGGDRQLLAIRKFGQRLKDSKPKFPPPPGKTEKWLLEDEPDDPLPGTSGKYTDTSGNLRPYSESESDTDTDTEAHSHSEAHSGAGERETVEFSDDSPDERVTAANRLLPRFNPAQVRALFDAYPRREAWGAAMPKIRDAMIIVGTRKDVPDPFVWLLKRVTEFAASPAGKNGRFVQRPASWFEDGRYDDDEAAWQLAGDKAGIGKPIGPRINPFTGKPITEKIA